MFCTRCSPLHMGPVERETKDRGGRAPEATGEEREKETEMVFQALKKTITASTRSYNGEE